eukprot:3011428-Pyramimonas_sp.AAC.1
MTAIRSARHLDEPCRTCLSNMRRVWKLRPHAMHAVPDTQLGAGSKWGWHFERREAHAPLVASAAPQSRQGYKARADCGRRNDGSSRPLEMQHLRHPSLNSSRR